MRKHYNVRIDIEEVTHTDGPSVYNNAKRQNVPTKGERVVVKVAHVDITARDLPEAIAKANRHLYVEDPTVFDEEDTVPATIPMVSHEEQAFINGLKERQV
jgi:hypothetical protein